MTEIWSTRAVCANDLRLAVGKSQSKLQNATIKVVQAEQQFPHRHWLGEDGIQLVAGVQALQSAAIHELQRSRSLVCEQTSCPILAAAQGVGHLLKRRRATQTLSELSFQPVRGAQLFGPAGWQVHRPQVFGQPRLRRRGSRTGRRWRTGNRAYGRIARQL